MDKKLIDISVKLMSYHAPAMLDLEMQKKHCSAIVLKGNVIAVGFNRYKTSQIALEFGYMYGEYHAELDALIQVHGDIVNYKKEDLSLINFRLNRFSDVGISRPCKKCMRWAKNVFGTFVYTDIDGGISLEDVDSGSSQKVLSSVDLRSSLGWKCEALRA